VAEPTFNPDGGTYFLDQAKNVTVETATAGSYLRYTFGAIPPTRDSGTPIYSSRGTISVKPTVEGRTLNVIAFQEGMADSEVHSATYYYEYEPTGDPPNTALAPATLGSTAANALAASANATSSSPNYDHNGNLTYFKGWVYTYDAQNRLRTANNGATSATFYYDGKNRQIARSINNVIRFSVWDGWELIEEYGSGRAAAYLQGANGVIKSWTYNNTLYYYQDKLGSTTHIANASGQLLESYRYDLYGTPSYFDSTSQPLNSSTHNIVDLYAGERWVAELGLYDLRNRFMSPELGRFLQADPIGFKGDASNLYRYCHNDPENFTDPMGLVDTSAIRQYSTLTSFGGGDWIKGSDGLSALDWNDKWRAQAGMDGGGGGASQALAVMGQHLGSSSQEQKAGESKGKSDAPLRFIVRRDKTENYRYNSVFYYQLATSSGKRLRGFEYVVTERTTVLHSDFGVKKSDDKYGPLTRDGLFVDGVGFTKRPGAGVTGSDIRLQRFELRTYDGQPGPPVSTVLRHETRKVNEQIFNNVFEVTP
jgi:RHS repeat-associated protein